MDLHVHLRKLEYGEKGFFGLLLLLSLAIASTLMQIVPIVSSQSVSIIKFILQVHLRKLEYGEKVNFFL